MCSNNNKPTNIQPGTLLYYDGDFLQASFRQYRDHGNARERRIEYKKNTIFMFLWYDDRSTWPSSKSGEYDAIVLYEGKLLSIHESIFLSKFKEFIQND
jgi:hypothetical protein